MELTYTDLFRTDIEIDEPRRQCDLNFSNLGPPVARPISIIFQ